MPRSIMSRVRNRLALLDRTQMVKLRLRTPVATFTFDDFPASAYDNGGKILEEYGARGTYFIAGSFLNAVIDGIKYTTPEQLKLVHARGHEIGCHTYDHKHLGAKRPGFARASCEKNSALMREILGKSFMMSSFAYPYGDVSPVLKHVMPYTLCRSVRYGVNEGSVDLAQIRIVSLEACHWDAEKIEKIIADAHGRNIWLVFLTHDVSDAPTAYGSTPDQIRRILHALKQADIPIKTLKAAAAYGVFGGETVAA